MPFIIPTLIFAISLSLLPSTEPSDPTEEEWAEYNRTRSEQKGNNSQLGEPWTPSAYTPLSPSSSPSSSRSPSISSESSSPSSPISPETPGEMEYRRITRGRRSEMAQLDEPRPKTLLRLGPTSSLSAPRTRRRCTSMPISPRRSTPISSPQTPRF